MFKAARARQIGFQAALRLQSQAMAHARHSRVEPAAAEVRAVAQRLTQLTADLPPTTVGRPQAQPSGSSKPRNSAHTHDRRADRVRNLAWTTVVEPSARRGLREAVVALDRAGPARGGRAA